MPMMWNRTIPWSRLSAPTPGLFTVAFEDLYLREDAGDADYNDFIATYNVTQKLNAENLVSEVTGWAYAKTKLAGYDHRFGLIINFEGDARLEVEGP